MLFHCKSSESYSYRKRRRKSTISGWRRVAVAGLKRKILSKCGCFMIVFILAMLTSQTCQSPALGRGGSSSGDPAPGRSPGPPFNDSTVLEEFLTEPSPLKDNIDNCAFSEEELNIVTVTPEDSPFNLTFNHPLFKADEDLTRGIIYEVYLSQTSGSSRVAEYSIRSTLDEENRGEFSTFAKEDQICKEDVKSKGNNLENNDIEVWNGVSVRNDNILEEYRLDNQTIKRSNISAAPNQTVFKREASKFFQVKHRERKLVETGRDRGPVVYGKLALDRKKIRLQWQINDIRIDEITPLNLTFRFRYRLANDSLVYEALFKKTVKLDCELTLYHLFGHVSWIDLPRKRPDCQLFFPSGSVKKHGLLVNIERLNVPCISRGFIKLSSGGGPYTQSMCGKLEEHPESERSVYFPLAQLNSKPYLHVHGSPLFLISYRLVDYCYNVTLSARNGSYDIDPTNSLHCTFRIHLPFGNRVALRLQMGEQALMKQQEATVESKSLQEVELSSFNDDRGVTECAGLSIRLWDGTNSWVHCSKPGDPLRNVQIISKQNSIIMYVVIRRTLSDSEKGSLFKYDDRVVKDNDVLSGEFPKVKRSVDDQSGMFLRFWYHADPIRDLVGQCSYGWVSLRQFCVTVFQHAVLPWAQAEAECVNQGGHLAGIRSENDQDIIDQMLIMSPGYRDHSAYWIGASDKASEGDFRWTDGLPFTFTHWFPGWESYGGFHRQPNDDGMSEEDCVELRRAYYPPGSSSAHLSPTYRWNDRDCSAPNHFVCERSLANDPKDMTSGAGNGCETSVMLGRGRPRHVVVSPGFPRSYPDGGRCDTTITAPPGYRIILDFEELVLENEPDCSYDYLEIWEPSQSPELEDSPEGSSKRLCGDWSDRLKLLRHVSHGPSLTLRFVADYSHHYTGFKATLTMENAMECSDDHQKLFNDNCYLIVSFPEVTWQTAQQVCASARAQLASIISAEEHSFIASSIRNSPEYTNSAIYWLGGKMLGLGNYEWVDGASVAFSGWLPGQSPKDMDILDMPDPQNPSCLGIQWKTSPTPMLPSGLYWTTQKCSHVGGFVCKRRKQLPQSNMKLNRIINDTEEGRLITPNYPENYPNNLDYVVKIVGPENTRIVIQFSKIDMEKQKDCLYDYVEVSSPSISTSEDKPQRWCSQDSPDAFGSLQGRLSFVSTSNEASVHVVSDYTGSASGFSALWRTVDVSACPGHVLTAMKQGDVHSPNYPYFLLPNLRCSFTIVAPPGKRIWLEIKDFDMQSNCDLEVELAPGDVVKPFSTPGRLADGAYLSSKESITIRLRTGEDPVGAGFHAFYKTVSNCEEERIVELGNVTVGNIMHVNHPSNPPASADLALKLIAPPGYTVLLRLHNLMFSDEDCPNGRGKIEVFDNYSDTNGTLWGLCESNTDGSRPPLAINSFFNSIRIKQHSESVGIPLNVTVSTQPDINYRSKLMQGNAESFVEGCKPNPCLNGGKCITTNGKSTCQCFGHFTGMFCALTACELETCVFGECHLTPNGHLCACTPGYTGGTCDTKVKPCESRPCENRGRCTERGGTFHCSCYAWWEGQKCERRMMNIPYKPLSERMLQEPFWLGLITVFVVLGVIGLVWCAKRHFPEKIEKLLAEEADRNRPNQLNIRGQSVRDSGLCSANASGLTAGTVTTGGSSAGSGSGSSVQNTSGIPQRGGSLFNRLGIRKPSLMSLHAPVIPPPAARTFSLDDLLRPPPRRTPSPRKKRNNSTPTKKNAAEKKQILQQLISPAQSRAHKVDELIQMRERNMHESDDGRLTIPNFDTQESSFINGDCSSSTASIRQLSDPKLEKKVTFARLLNKVSAEMSSGSEVDTERGMKIQQGNRTMMKAASTPPSPGTGNRSPNSTSSNQGSESMSSLETALPGMGLRRFAGRGNKISSADSILAMFRNFSSSTIGASMPSSIVVSPSTTPSIASPQEDVPGDDDSTTSSLYTPISYSSGPPDSPVFYRQSNSQSTTIEVPVLDALTAHKAGVSSSNLLHPPTILLEIPSQINKCLSPIRELPTPLPSPALTPIMHRSQASVHVNTEYDDAADDQISLEIPCTTTEDEDDITNQEISIAMAEGSRPNSTKLKVRPPPIGRDTLTPKMQLTDETPSPMTQSHDSEREYSSSCGRASASSHDLSPQRPALVIPLLTIEQPSPTKQYTGFLFAGSPPPQRASIGETSFLFPNKQQQKKLLKEFEKPTSLDLAVVPPMITITCNMSDAESDADSISPANRPPKQSLAPPGPSTMCYLSPFSICTRGDRTTSDSNLSSSGYSSMASPGPSRCGSSNPLCPSEMEDPGPGSGPGHSGRRASPLVKTNSGPSGSSTTNNNGNEQKGNCRGRSDSETLSDDPLLESNDEGISTDHLEERIDDNDLKSARELEVFLKSENAESDKSSSSPNSLLLPSPKCTTSISVEKGLDRLSVPSKMSLQLPSIVINTDSKSSIDKLLSPVSSRSESPLSDRTTGLGRFSPHFYSRHKDQLPFTDSDGLYDFPSSECVHQNSGSNGKSSSTSLQSHRKSTGRRRERRNSRSNTGSITPSPTKSQLPHSMHNLLDVPGKDPFYRMPAPRKLSPKRRSRSQQPISSSSSSESLNSAREVTVRLSTEIKFSPNTDPGEWPKQEWAAEASGEDTGEDVSIKMLPKSPVVEELPKPIRKISRMRTIGHQIRFLRRLEQSLKQRERFAITVNSDDEGEDSSSVTSPLLQSNIAAKAQIKKGQGVKPNPQQSYSLQNQPRPKITRQKKSGSAVAPELTSTQNTSWRSSLGISGPNDISD